MPSVKIRNNAAVLIIAIIALYIAVRLGIGSILASIDTIHMFRWLLCLTGILLVAQVYVLAQSRRLLMAAYSSANKEDRSKLESLARSKSSFGKTARLVCSQLDRNEVLTAELQASERLYQMILNSCPSGLIVWNTDSRIADWNPAAELIFGWTRQEAVAKASPQCPQARTDAGRDACRPGR